MSKLITAILIGLAILTGCTTSTEPASAPSSPITVSAPTETIAIDGTVYEDCWQAIRTVGQTDELMALCDTNHDGHLGDIELGA
jgi:hypothetical protein